MKSGSSAAKLGRSSRAKADCTCSHSMLSALMLLLLPSLSAKERDLTDYLGIPLWPGRTLLLLLLTRGRGGMDSSFSEHFSWPGLGSEATWEKTAVDPT